MKRLMLFVLFVLVPALVQAQLVSNPTTLELDSSTHYSAPVETYRILFTQVGAGAPFSQFDVTAGAVTILDPVIVRLSINLRTTPGSTLNALPFGTQYTASVVAMNISGSAPRSAESNPFVRAQIVPAAVSGVVVKP